ncbi:Cobyrinic acid ac-diamide synthase [Solidesulfovibrio fructosivorans JJ]]|uniref:Cobyrinic acid ac-diamide synthase n=1 Tax=Solidesulfovibrio fructosivorans JJ] TaxID=596151 RepID=E1JR46_SOLFR|nr:ParA family protein [Solidesulfovibrio fructosivorans]EFL53047.1 Cobyrinic acid ac-diamide synthase [Solidesulfovibrio fructosivorans JJ]]
MDVQEPGVLRIACCNHKGGVGKTTCAVNLAAGLCRAGWRVVVVDADPQAHLTASLGLRDPGEEGLAAVLGGDVPVSRHLIEADGLRVLPAAARLATVETELSRREAPETLLAAALADLSDCDVVLFDCPPHLGPLTRQVLGAATRVIVPMTPDYLSMQSLAWLMGTLSELTGNEHAGPSVLGIVLNRFSARKRLHREVRRAVAGHFPDLPFETPIRENVSLAEAPSHGQDIFRYAPTSAGAQDFAAVCRELARRAGEPANTAKRGAK